MSIIIHFFAAPDDHAAASVTDTGPGRRFGTVQHGNFVPDLALMEWEVILTGGSFEGVLAGGGPRLVACPGQGSAAVIAFTAALTAALAAADEDRLAEAGEQWAQLRAGDGEEFDPVMAGELLSEVATLASSAAGRGHQMYCWRC